MNTKKRIALSLSIFAVLMIVTAAVTLIYVQQDNAFNAALYGATTTNAENSFGGTKTTSTSGGGGSNTNGGGS